MNLEITFSIDPTGFAQDIKETIVFPKNLCLYCLHDRSNRFIDEVKKCLVNKGYDLRWYFQIMKIYVK